MSREERTGQRDLGFSQWHRRTFPDNADMIDIDSQGVCPEKNCRTPLWVIETYQGDRPKATSILAAFARKAMVPGLLVNYWNDNQGQLDDLKAFMIWPHSNRKIGDKDALAAYLMKIRRAHEATYHPE